MSAPDNSPEITPDTEVDFLLHMLGSFYVFTKRGSKEEMLAKFKAYLESDADDIDRMENLLLDEEEVFQTAGPGRKAVTGYIILTLVLNIALAYCAEVRRAKLPLGERWWHVGQAHGYLGYLRGSITGQRMGGLRAATERAVKAAAGRHKENHAIKEQVFVWLAENLSQYKTNPAAVDAVRKIAPIAHSTALAYIKEFRKLHLKKTGASAITAKGK